MTAREIDAVVAVCGPLQFHEAPFITMAELTGEKPDACRKRFDRAMEKLRRKSRKIAMAVGR
jgi:hypothetical protein